MSDSDKVASEKSHYDFQLALEKAGDAHAIQFELTPRGASVLDVGCHTGIMGEALRQKKGCRVVGIDQDTEPIMKARERLDAAFVVDIEREGWREALRSHGESQFDAILFGDVLEHTRDPQKILEACRPLLKQGGRVIVSVPNVANLRVRLGLLFGNFDYQDSGILDRTHLRFFTQKTSAALVRAAGYTIQDVRVTRYGLPYWLVKLLPRLLGVQFVIAATPQ